MSIGPHPPGEQQVQRHALLRIFFGALFLIPAVTVSSPVLQNPGQRQVLFWIVFLMLSGAAAVTTNLGVRTTFGTVTMVPTAALMCYFVLGNEAGIAAAGLGLLAGGAVDVLRPRPTHEFSAGNILRRLGDNLWHAGQSLAALMAAGLANRLLAGPEPLTQLADLAAILPVITTIVIFFLVFNALLLADLAVQGLPLRATLIVNRRSLLAMQLLPMALAPFSALALNSMGIGAFAVVILILLTIVVVVHYLDQAQATLEEQIKQISAISSMNRALRSSLEITPLLENVYLQAAGLLNVNNLHILLRKPGAVQWSYALAVENGRRIQRPSPDQLDDLITWVLEEENPLLAEPVPDAMRKLRLNNPPPQARSWMGIPLMASNRLIGGMYTWLEPGQQTWRRFSPRDLELFINIAVQMSVGLENALLYEEAGAHAARLKRLNRLSNLLNSSLDPSRVIELIVASTLEIAECQKAAVYLLETDEVTGRPRLKLRHASGFSAAHMLRTPEVTLPINLEQTRQLVEEQETLAISDVFNSGGKQPPALLSLAEMENFRAYAYVPMTAQSTPIGMLALYHEQPHKFSRTEIELLEAFANQAALAMENARLYQRVDDELARRIGQTMIIAEIGRRLGSTLNLREIFDVIIDSALSSCPAQSGVLLLLGDLEEPGQLGAEGTLNMVAWRGFDPTSVARAPHNVAQSPIVGRVLNEGRTVIINHTTNEEGVGAQMAVPIIIDQRVIGCMILESPERDIFGEDDLAFGNQLAVQAAVAIRNAQLYSYSQIVGNRLHATLDANNDGLLMIDAKARAVMSNARMNSFWDFALEETPKSVPSATGDSLDDLAPGLGYAPAELRNLLAHGIRSPNMSPKTDLYVTRGVGTKVQRFVERTATAVRDERGNFIGLLLIFRDVTAQKELDQAREDLTSMMVHDLRGPLTAVMTTISIIEKRVPPDEKVVRQAAATSTRAVKKLLAMVNNLLDVSRLGSGQLYIDPSTFDVDSLLQSTVDELKPLAKEMEVDVQIDVNPELPEALADKDMIERVMLNLLDNALKYTHAGTSVKLRALYEGRAASLGSDMICIEVIDHGPGIPDAYKQEIFERFKRVPGSKGRRTSSGIGLAFCRLAVEAHGGSISVRDNPAGGSIFSFTIPMYQPPKTLL